MQSIASVTRRWAMPTRRFLSLLVVPAALAVAAAPAQAAFPDRPVRIVVPFSPGGGTDAISRTLGQGLSASLGQPVLIDNRPGAGTLIGSDLVAKSPPDGTTLLMATFAHAVNPAMQPKLPYDTDKAFAPVALVGVSPNVLVVRADAPYKTVADLVAAARAAPGKLTYASQGNGTSAHLAGALLGSLGAIDISHVPYRGAGPALTDLMGGQVAMMFATASAAKPLVTGGKLRALAVTTVQRSPAWPGVPTMAEAGVAGYAAESWYGVYAPAGTPAAVIERLNGAIREAVKTPAFAKQTEAEGLDVDVGSPEALGRYVRAQEKRWGQIVRDNRITSD